MAHQLLLLVAAPIGGACILAVLPRARVGVVCAVTSAAAAVALAVAVPLWFQFSPRGAQWQFVDRIDAGGWQVLVALDGFALGAVLLTAFVTLAASLLLARETDQRARWWAVAMLLLEGGAFGTFVSIDARQLFLFWHLAIAAVVVMLLLAGRKSTAVAAAGLAAVAAAAMYSGILALGERHRELATVVSYDIRGFQTMPVPTPVQMQAFVLIALGSLTPFVLVALLAWAAGRSGGELASGLSTSMLLAALAVFGFVRVVLPVMPQAARAFAAAMMIGGGIAAALAMAAAAGSRARIAVYWTGLGLALVAMVGVFAATPAALTGAALLVGAATLMVAALVPVAESARFTFAPRNLLTIVLTLGALTIGFAPERQVASGLAPFGRTAEYAIHLVCAAGMIVLAAQAVRRASEPAAAGGSSLLDRPIAVLPAAALLVGLIYSGPLFARLETSVARVVVRVSPEYASQVADCLNQPPPPPPPGSGLPTGMMLAAPCSDPSGAADPAVKR
jgi:NADH-quinone oxidoreductase subunit M